MYDRRVEMVGNSNNFRTNAIVEIENLRPEASLTSQKFLLSSKFDTSSLQFFRSRTENS